MQRILIVSNEIGKDALGEMREAPAVGLPEGLCNIPNLVDAAKALAGDAETRLVHHRELEACSFQGFDRVILSGFFPDRPFTEAELKEEFEAELKRVRQADIPVLGICLGIQLIGLAFGAGIQSMERAGGEHGYVPVQKEKEHPLLMGLPSSFSVLGLHGKELNAVPEGFDLLVSGRDCRVQAIAHRERPLYGVQFHPELRSEKNEGARILYNFLRL